MPASSMTPNTAVMKLQARRRRKPIIARIPAVRGRDHLCFGASGCLSDRLVRRLAVQGGPAKIREALVPPKPKEFDSTYSTLRSRACFGTKSMSQEGDGLSRFKVGGTTWSRSASTAKIASTVPAAPNRWPIADLVEDIDRE